MTAITMCTDNSCLAVSSLLYAYVKNLLLVMQD